MSYYSRIFLLAIWGAMVSAAEMGQELKLNKDGEKLKLKEELAKDFGIEMVLVKGGCFQMGSNVADEFKNEILKSFFMGEKPVHEVCLNDFYLGKYEVTQGQWKVVMGNNPSKFQDCGDACPVEQVSWNDAQEFIRKLNQMFGKNYRLPTEAEWEYAARSGGKKEEYSGTNDRASVGNYAWYEDNSGKTTHPVGLKSPNGLGIYDMSGNVDEWVNDWLIYSYYGDSPQGQSPGAFWR